MRRPEAIDSRQWRSIGPVNPANLGALAPLWTVAFKMGPPPIGPGFIAYPVIPWFGVMCLGYALGPVFVLFCVLRGLNAYGDPAHWRAYPTATATVMSSFNVSKYPPSLLYVLITLGVALLCMLALQRLRGLLAQVLLAYGRTPLFTYVLHIYVVHGASLVVAMLAGYPASSHANFLADPFRLYKAGFGFNLLVVYVAWLTILVALYPASRWFAAIKRQRREWWLSYL
jgi:uncharacterized membrane protein